MSMVASDFLFNINQRMKDVFDSKEEFGGRALILAGDLLQLPPVNGRQIFKEPKFTKNKNYFNIQPTENEKGGNLWANCEVIYLKTNFRQGEGNPYSELINRVRIGKATEEDKKLLKSRKSTLMTEEQSQKAAHIYYKRKDVANYNRSMLSTIHETTFEIHAKYDVPKRSNYRPFINERKGGTIGQSNFLDVLQVKIGSRVMLIYNVNIPDFLVNGALGTVIGIELDKNGNVECIVVRFDDPKIGMEQMNDNKYYSDKYSEQRGCPIFKQTVEQLIMTQRGRNSGKAHGFSYKLTQFPLTLAWASTGHKVQGLQFEKGSDIVTHGDQKMPDGTYHVMLSRAVAFENVFNDNFLPNKLKPNAEALAEDRRLKARSIVPSYQNMEYSFFVLNVRSLAKHFFDVCQDMYAQRSDHICLVETWIQPEGNATDQLTMTNRSFEEASVGKGKGCCIYTQIPKKATSVEKILEDAYQVLSIVDEKIQLILCYISSNPPYLQIAKDIEKLIKQKKKIIITGDFNFDINEMNNLSKFFKNQKFKQLVNLPTHDKGRSLDHCYVSKDIKDKVTIKHYSPYYSDHDALCISVDF